MKTIEIMFLFYSAILILIKNGLVDGDISINDEVPAGQLITDLANKTVFSQHFLKIKSSFRLISTGPFMTYLKIESDTGKLFANKKIDRDYLCVEIEKCCTFERICVIPISVAMISTITEPFTQQIQIHIYDFNDHKPTFNPSSFNLSIGESCPLSTTFLLPLAIDQDSADYSVKTYRLISQENDEMFVLDTQLVDNKLAAYLRLRQKLDRESIDRYTLMVIAIDGGEPSLTGTLNVFITITDVNDNPPIFETTQYKISVKESQIFREPITKVVATDKDIDENSEIFYKLDNSMSSVGSSDFFRIDIRTGSLFLISSLDYEKQQSFKLIILAANREPGISTATATVIVNVVNTNDEKPSIIIDYLSNRQHALISENVVGPIFVAIITVTDKDKGISGKVICKLNNYEDIFDLKQTSQDQFKVYTRQHFDRETVSRYSLIVVCQDQGIPPLTSEATISVLVLDENDNSPEIKSPSSFKIRENKPSGTILTRIHAFDKDDGLNSRLHFSISDVNNIISSFLRIDSQSGTIRTTQIIDRESKNPPLSSIDFILTVTDSGVPKLTTTMSLQLIIEDENDNEPQFSQTEFRFTISENEPPPYRLGQIDVNDSDEDKNLRLSLTYNQKNYRKCPFSLIKEKGIYWLSTTKSLDWEDEPVHELIVVATDGSVYKSHTSTAIVIVTVLDVNDHKPLFIFPRPGNNSWHLVSYRNKPGFVIITISASDKDNPTSGNGRFHFSIVSDPDNIFNIDPNLGKIRIQRQMIISDIGDHILLIKVEDHGVPVLSSEIKINIRVTDSPTLISEKMNENESNNFNNNDQEKGFFTDKEIFLVFGLVIILFLFIICICFILYMRHIRGWLHFIPDIIGFCHSKEQNSKRDQSRKQNSFIPPNSDQQFTKESNYPTQKFMASFPPSYCQTPEPLIKNNRDCYEALKIGTNTSPMKLIQGQSYNDILTATRIPQYHDSYLTLHQYPYDFPSGNYNLKSKSLKPMRTSQWNINIPSEKITNTQTASINSQNSYAVTFPTEESTFV